MPPIDKKHQDSIDNVLYDSSKYIAPIFRKLNFTANNITTLSNICMCITILLLLHTKYYWACLFIILTYYFDCLDGFFARTYKQASSFGEKYDHYSDLCKTIALLSTLYYINSTKFFKVMPIFIIFSVMTFTYCGCVDKINNDNILFSSYTKQLCPITDINNKDEVNYYMNIVKNFGPGMVNILYIIIFIYYAQ